MDYKLLKFRDNWGMHEYYTGANKLVNPKTINVIDNNGAGHLFNVVCRLGVETVYDHGKRDDVESLHYYVVFDFLGETFEIPLPVIMKKFKVYVQLDG